MIDTFDFLQFLHNLMWAIKKKFDAIIKVDTEG